MDLPQTATWVCLHTVASLGSLLLNSTIPATSQTFGKLVYFSLTSYWRHLSVPGVFGKKMRPILRLELVMTKQMNIVGF